MQSVTKYFRDVVASSSQQTIEYKDGEFITISLTEINNMQLNKNTMDFVWKKDTSIDTDIDNKSVRSKAIIIALKTIVTEYKEGLHLQKDLEEMTSVLFMPLQVDHLGALKLPEDGKMPWIPREYLIPMEDYQLAIGNQFQFDNFFEITTDQRNQIDTVKKYIEYTKQLYEYVTSSKFTDDHIYIGNDKVRTDGKFYLFLDTMVYSTFNILRLYNHLLKNDNYTLYLNLINGKTEKSKQLYSNNNISKMKNHVGQMNGEFPLSPSQRESINHLDEIKNGEILAIKGPPGTGKTTFLQSAVANLYVKSALKGDKAPIIVATSTNNKAVTNIIDSFGKIDSIGVKNLEKRWITNVHSFATYFPSKGKIKESKANNYQYTNVLGQFFLEEIENENNKKIC